MDNDYKYNPLENGEMLNTEQEKEFSNTSDRTEGVEEKSVETPVLNEEVFEKIEPEVLEIQETPQEVGVEMVENEKEKDVEQRTPQNAGMPTYDYDNKDFGEKNEKKEKAKSKKGKKWVLCIVMAILFGAIASGVFQISNLVIGKVFEEEITVNDAKSVVDSTEVTISENSDKVLTDVAQVAQNAMPSVVSITTLAVQEVQNFFFGGTTIQEYESTGSGIIVGQNDTELLIVSNNHVVAGSNSLTVSFVDGNSIEGQIKATDEDIDLAVISVPLKQIQNDTMKKIKIAVLGDSNALVVGEPTIAIGNALGYGQSVTTGIVSALNRQIDGFDAKLIQTDAAINPGNSGGALLNGKGEVIGINTVKVNADAVEGMGYAIPISDITDILNELMNRETKTKVAEANRGVLGISGVTVDENASKLYGMPQGVHVSEVLEGGGAEKAGLPKGCIIVKIEKVKVKSMEDLAEQLEYYEAGESVKLTIMQAGQDGEYVEKEYDVTLSKRSLIE